MARALGLPGTSFRSFLSHHYPNNPLSYQQRDVCQSVSPEKGLSPLQSSTRCHLGTVKSSGLVPAHSPSLSLSVNVLAVLGVCPGLSLSPGTTPQRCVCIYMYTDSLVFLPIRHAHRQLSPASARFARLAGHRCRCWKEVKVLKARVLGPHSMLGSSLGEGFRPSRDLLPFFFITSLP